MNRYGIRLVISIMLSIVPCHSSSTSGCSRRWCQYRAMQCVNESSALTRWNSASVHGCLLKASETPDDLVLQWNRQAGSCSLFHYQQVCRKPLNNESLSDCLMYRAKALASCDASLNPALLGVWLAGGFNRFSNLVCQSEPAANHRLVSANLQWTGEGAQFNGVSSYALLNDSRFFSVDFSAGFTWLMRLRREPRVQPFMEATSFDGAAAIGSHIWEHNFARRLFFNPVANGTTALLSLDNQLPATNSTWINIAAVKNAGGPTSNLFYNGSFVNSQAVESWNIPANCCNVYIGHRQAGNHYLLGVVQAVAIANRSLSAQEIQRFFALLP